MVFFKYLANILQHSSLLPWRFWKQNRKCIAIDLCPFLLYLSLLWRRPLSYRNQSIDLLRKSMDSFLYDNGHRHERVNKLPHKTALECFLLLLNRYFPIRWFADQLCSVRWAGQEVSPYSQKASGGFLANYPILNTWVGRLVHRINKFHLIHEGVIFFREKKLLFTEILGLFTNFWNMFTSLFSRTQQDLSKYL